MDGLHARFAGEWREWVRLGVKGFSGVGTGEVVVEVAVGGKEFFGAAVVRFEVSVGEGPGGGDAPFMVEDAEVLNAEAEEGGSVDFGLAADKVGLLRVEWLIVFVEPDILGVIVIVEEDGGRVPVEFLLGEEGAALEDEDALTGLGEMEGESAAAGSSSDDDGVVLVGHEVLSEAQERMAIRAVVASFPMGELIGFDEVFFNAGEEEGEDGAVADWILGAAEGEASAMAFDDASGDPKTKAGAVEILGGVEGFEDAATDGGRHAVAGVGDGDAEATAAVGECRGVVHGVVGADDEAASLAHGVDGVGDEVVEDLADVVFKAENGGGSGVAGFDVDAGVGEAAVVEVKDGIDEIGRTDLRGADSLAMETEGLSGDLADARKFGLGYLDVVADAVG
jgi:hypothetical protein